MFAFSVFARRSPNVLGAVVALLMGSTLAGQRAEALSLMNPGVSHAGTAAASERTIEVRGGHGGGGGGGGGGRGAIGSLSGGRGISAGSFSGAVVRGAPIGPGVAGVATAPRFAGRPFFHHRHFRGAFIGGVYYDDYPYDYPDYYDVPTVYPEPAYSVPAYVAGGGCRRVLTVHGPRVICHHRAARHHRIHRRRHHRRHHHA